MCNLGKKDDDRTSSRYCAEDELMNSPPMSPTLLTNLNDEQRKITLERYHHIEPYLKGRISLKELCETKHFSLRTAKIWVKLYREGGLIALARKPRNDKGKNRVISLETRHLIEGIYLKSPYLSFASIHRQIEKYLIEKNIPCPKYRTVCALLNNLPKSMTTLAHKGSKEYRQQFDLIYIREANQPNEIWQADHCKLDIFLLNQKGTPQKPWLTIIFDDYSRSIAGYELSFTDPSVVKTALALRQSIWRKKEPAWTIYGIPQILYTDHGSDFTSKHMEQVCIALKINLIFSNVGEPRGRGKIERFFLTLNQLLLCELPGYTGNRKESPVLTLTDLDGLIRKFIIDYNQSEHSQIRMIPKIRWEENGFLPHMPEHIEQLDLLLLTIAKPRKIRRDGIHFQGLRYMDSVLADYVNEDVIIRYDPADITSIRVFYKNQFLCQPICTSLDRQVVGIKDIQAARNARKRALTHEIKNRISLVDAILNTKSLSHKASSPIEKPPRKKKLKLYESDT
ncbi:MAG: transposase-like Mu [Gammaproteobacteria bacterium]|nr:transposase-like Mu [Gammaproteobacteria bacterium]